MACRLLIANSNTSATVTKRLVRAAQAVASPASTIEGVTAGFGAAAIQTEEEARVAAEATLDLLDRAQGTHDAAIIACFADPGLDTARTRYAVPVLGLGHASLHTAIGFAGRIAILTAAGSVAALTRSGVARYGLAASVPCVLEVPDSLQDLLSADARTFQAVEGAIAGAVRDHGIRGILLGGAFFAGLEELIHSPVPIFDPIALAVGCAELCLRTASRSGEKTARPVGKTSAR